MDPIATPIADLAERPRHLRDDARAWTVGEHAVIFVEGPTDDCWVSVLGSPFGWTYTLRVPNDEEIRHYSSDAAALEAALPVAHEVGDAEFLPGKGDFDTELARLRLEDRSQVELVRFLYWNDGNSSFDDLLTAKLQSARVQFDEIVDSGA